jgi:hypothetical protein
MEECPFCHKPLEDIDNFCRSCGANLMLPEFERAFCPHCGARVLPGQWYCQQCRWPLEEGLEKKDQEGAFATLPTARTAPSKPNFMWIIGGLLGAGLVILVVLTWFFRETLPAPFSDLLTSRSRGIPNVGSGQSSPIQAEPPSSLPKSAPANPQSGISQEILRQQVAEVLNNLQEAQREKDIAVYMKSYSGSFPSLGNKRSKTLAVWKIYDYISLQYSLENVTLLDAKTAVAQVSWNMETRNRANQKNEKFIQTYKVWFSLEDEGWRIKNLEELPKP